MVLIKSPGQLAEYPNDPGDPQFDKKMCYYLIGIQTSPQGEIREMLYQGCYPVALRVDRAR